MENHVTPADGNAKLEVISDAHRLAAAGADCETILVFLRERKFDKIDSIKTIRLLYNLSMSAEKDFK